MCNKKYWQYRGSTKTFNANTISSISTLPPENAILHVRVYILRIATVRNDFL